MLRVPEEPEHDPSLTPPSSLNLSLSPPIHVVRYQEESEVPWLHVKQIGHGSYGVVDKIEDTRNSNTVYARKKMKRESNRVALRNFNNEFENLRRLRSAPPNRHLVELIQAYTFRDDYYLVISPLADMTLRDLFDRVHNKHSQDTHDASFRILRRAFGCLAQGLAFLHSNNIRHKDVKPTNILVCGDRDFGHSFVFDPGQSTSTGEATGAEKFRAPEMTDRTRHNRKTDIFSLGCVYLEMIAAFRRIDPRKETWPLNSSARRQDRGRYARNIANFQMWLEEYIEARKNAGGDTSTYLTLELLRLCQRTIEPTAIRRIDASHLVSEMKDIDSKDTHNQELWVHCEQCRQSPFSQFESRTRWYCTKSGCQSGPFFDEKELSCPNCNAKNKRQEFKSGILMRNDREYISQGSNLRARPSRNTLQPTLNARGSRGRLESAASNPLQDQQPTKIDPAIQPKLNDAIVPVTIIDAQPSAGVPNGPTYTSQKTPRDTPPAKTESGCLFNSCACFFCWPCGVFICCQEMCCS